MNLRTALRVGIESTARHLKRKNLLFLFFFFRIVQYLFLPFFQPLNWKKFTPKYRLSRLVYSCCKRRVSSRIKSIVTCFQVIFAATRKCRKHTLAELVLRTRLACWKVWFGWPNFLYISDWHVAFLHTNKRKLFGVTSKCFLS
jgi:hypothetical protein